MIEPYLATLNAKQRRAVEYSGDQPLLIIAGAGSGKTNTLEIKASARQRRLSAMHEAGHAVIGRTLGIIVASAEIFLRSGVYAEALLILPRRRHVIVFYEAAPVTMSALPESLVMGLSIEGALRIVKSAHQILFHDAICAMTVVSAMPVANAKARAIPMKIFFMIGLSSATLHFPRGAITQRGSKKRAETIDHKVRKQPHQRRGTAKYENDWSRNAHHRPFVCAVRDGEVFNPNVHFQSSKLTVPVKRRCSSSAAISSMKSK
jgi:hypothetical protein